MQIPQIIPLLENTLNPSLIHQASQSLQNQRQTPGFITNLLIISDNSQYTTSIRQSALVYIKNAIIDDFNKTIQLPDNDFQTVKSSILQALIRNCQQKSISPTIKQIIFVLAQQQFPQNWYDIIPQIANNIQNSGDFNELFGSIEALKAIVSAIVKKVDIRLTLDNTCNKIVLPLLSLASKLFQSYNDTTSFILISIFKIFSTITNFHIPEIVILNMHSWMLFIKKILDLNIEAGNIDMNMYQLKKICLRILFRFYQRHLNRKFSSAGQDVIDDFHKRFTKGITQSLLLQIINQSQLTKNSSNKNYIQLTKYSLACLAYVYQQDRNASIIIDHYKQKIIYLCLQRYKTKLTKSYSSYGEFTSQLSQQRTHLCQFITSLIRNQTKRVQQLSKGDFNYYNSHDAITILGCLYNYIQKGDDEMKELCLYIYSRIAVVLPQGDGDIQSKMLMFILNIVKPLLHQESSTPIVIKLRCCQILTQYSYIHLPQSQLTQIASGVYSCLISPTQNHPDISSMQTFLQIQSVYAFNSLLRYEYIINFTSPYLSNILQVYTSLLEIEVSMIKCLEDMLGKFQQHLQPYGNGLVEMLTNMFFKYHQMVVGKLLSLTNNNNNQSYTTSSKRLKGRQQQQDSQDQQQDMQSSQNNYLNASKACLSAIRQIIQVPQFIFQKDQLIHDILILIFTDRQMLYIQQGFNILNQILFKSKTLKQQYNIYFSLIIFGILPLNNTNYINALKSENSSYSNTLVNMLECQCADADADPDFLQNTIGCLRNFIAKYNQSLRNQFDKSGMSFLQLVLNTVKYVHENQSTKANQSQRSIILTIYMSLIQWKALNDTQVKEILETVAIWMDMQKQAIRAANQVIENQNQNKEIKEEFKKTVYCPIYMQIILLACHFYPQVTFTLFNGGWLAEEILHNWQRFHIDYEISRLLIGIADLLGSQVMNEQKFIGEIMNRLPDTIEILCKMRVGEFGNVLDSEDDEAEEERYFGLDENTHIMGWRRPNVAQRQNQQQQQQNNQMDDQDSESQDQQDQEFNKYYESPLDSIDEVAYIFNTLRSAQSQPYMNLMTNDSQQKLSYLVQNTPQKFNQQNNN